MGCEKVQNEGGGEKRVHIHTPTHSFTGAQALVPGEEM